MSRPHCRRWMGAMAVAALLIAAPARIAAHPAPFSYLDVRIEPSGLSGRIVVHAIDIAHELQLPSPASLADPVVVRTHAGAVFALVSSRLALYADGRRAGWRLEGAKPVTDQDAVEFTWRAPLAGMPGSVAVEGRLFPYDATHQTFVNVYEGGTVAWQEVLNRQRTRSVFYTGTAQGRLAVVRNFTASGIHHIAIGPDHILFIVGLLLLGGSLPRLLGIVTAFTAGHSLTLALATLGVVDPPARLVEPAIALSILYVGADNLLTGSSGRDVRMWVALFFGLVHGFGFASVLRETGLPPQALGLSLFAFNLGVEMGQAAIVVVVAFALSLLRQRNATLARKVVTAGSAVVMAAGAFWFVERVF